MTNANCVIGFIGTGVMGRSMASHLMKKGYSVLVNNRTKSSADSLVKNGAIWKDNVADIAKDADIIITMVGYPKDVEEIYLGEKGILNNAKSGTYVIDMTTSEPSLAKEIYEKAKEKGIYSLDAPVSGGDVGAKNATLTIMVGGDKDAFEEMMPVFEVMGKNIILQGGAGAGQHTKMCNQIAIASNMIGVSEAMLYAKKAGLDPERVLESIGAGAAGSWSLSNLAPRMIKGDFEPGFYVKHMVKDMKIALAEAEKMGLWTPGLELSKSLYDEIVREHKENKGTQVLFELLDK
jgi:3-hydroxyisobutyrate dehydrogenase